MFTHVMVGSNDLERSRRFYDATFAALGGQPGDMDSRGRLIYAFDGGRFEPLRVSRRLQLLSRMEPDEQNDEQVLG